MCYRHGAVALGSGGKRSGFRSYRHLILQPACVVCSSDSLWLRTSRSKRAMVLGTLIFSREWCLDVGSLSLTMHLVPNHPNPSVSTEL
jgi:hypothetical protein